MIGRLRGTILEKQPPLVLIETQGVGYEVQMPMTCFYNLPEINQEVTILTHFVVREDSQLLFGFNNKNERIVFRELIKVSGIGPKLALAILSGMSVQQFITIVKSEEIELLAKLPGIGKKTAYRLMVEMKDRLKYVNSDFLVKKSNFLSIPTLSSIKNNNVEIEAVAALISLGYKPHEASSMISKVGKPNVDCETLIREALCSAI